MWSGLFWGLPSNYSFPQNCLWLTLTLHFVLSSYSCCDLFWSCGNGFWVTPPRKFRHPGVFCDGHLRKKLGHILGLLRCESEGIEMAMSGFCMCLSIVPPHHPPWNGLRPSCRKEWFSERTLQQIFFALNTMFGRCLRKFFNLWFTIIQHFQKLWTVMWSDGMAKM